MGTATTLTRRQVKQHTLALFYGPADFYTLMRGDHIPFPPLTRVGNERFTENRLYTIIIEEMEKGVTERGRAAFGKLFNKYCSLDWISGSICDRLNITA